ncbi:MAG TPA: hypothetical protein VKX28_06125 [Xanthobacteraceae bacterium]|nr:hypothetical protein [Xanthobacteraceae bacterium]
MSSQPNDLEAPARALQPVISDVLAALVRCGDCLFARMSGSGATCFGLFGATPLRPRPPNDCPSRTQPGGSRRPSCKPLNSGDRLSFACIPVAKGARQ